jgi:outer membrane lipoprotein-sorting protein
MKPWLCSLALLLSAPSALAQESRPSDTAADGRAIARELRRRNTGYGDLTAEIEMLLSDAGGHESRRHMRIRVLEGREDGDRSLVVFDSPADVRGTALLSHAGLDGEDEQWLYLPAAHRVRRISSGNTTGPFLGSEFTYEDITGNEVRKHDWTLRGVTRCPSGSGECFEVETRPRYDGSAYARRVLFVDRAEYRVQRIDFYDHSNRLLKTLEYGEYRQYLGRYWRAHRWTMRNRQNGRTTVLTFPEYRFRTGLDASDFTRSALERAR